MHPALKLIIIIVVCCVFLHGMYIGIHDMKDYDDDGTGKDDDNIYLT